MKRSKATAKNLLVSAEAIEDFSRLSTEDRLRWLDEARSFLAKVVPQDRLKTWGRWPQSPKSR